MIIARTLSEWREHRAQWPDDIGFVPTMGGLHDGHVALVRAARRHAWVAVSVYVNPLQFGPQEDFAAYPRTEEADCARLAQAGVDAVFLPTEAAIYPHGREWQTEVRVPGLSEDLCGRYRPGHFEGVTTVVARLFGIVRPRACYMGKKDYQQWRIVTRMVADLGLPVTVTGIETIRESDGLALSTRNTYLTAAERACAPGLYETLTQTATHVTRGAAPADAEAAAMARLMALGFVPDYVAVRRAADLALPTPDDSELVVLAAARLGRTRLIDNLEFRRIGRADGGHWQRSAKAG
ncbi:pantoate--beta-alanine ligase [Acidiferrobacter sp.]|jgi:pantoate--beta-alanine ligase|uniref:pantoate--beta-alanine ligase n=1 Tax=Acidiferrobacter sp. TaxID=1872107 RepID=UPI00260C7F72|nr:pantoate--beta-alanine ligase [Acidiferrobacter sp.]